MLLSEHARNCCARGTSCTFAHSVEARIDSFAVFFFPKTPWGVGFLFSFSLTQGAFTKKCCRGPETPFRFCAIFQLWVWVLGLNHSSGLGLWGSICVLNLKSNSPVAVLRVWGVQPCNILQDSPSDLKGPFKASFHNKNPSRILKGDPLKGDLCRDP